MGRVKQCRAVLLDVRRCSAATAARMLRDLLATDTLLPPAIAANVLTAADLLDSLPRAAQDVAPAIAASAHTQGTATVCCVMVSWDSLSAMFDSITCLCTALG